MTKLGFTMTSFVAAIPGAVLCYFLIVAFMTQFEHMSTIMMVLAGCTLLIALIVALIPFGVLVFFKSAPKTESTDLAGGTSTIEDDVEVDDELLDDDDSLDDAEVDSFGDDEFESDGEIAEATDDFEDDDDDMIAEESDEFDDDDDEFDFDFDDDE